MYDAVLFVVMVSLSGVVLIPALQNDIAVESSINALENHGLDRCLDHGLHGFERYVALSVLARNIQILGHLLQQKELKKQKRRKAA